MLTLNLCIIIFFIVLYVAISICAVNNQLIYRLDDKRLLEDDQSGQIKVMSSVAKKVAKDVINLPAPKPVRRKFEKIGHNYGWYSMPLYRQRPNAKFRKGFGHGPPDAGDTHSFWNDIARDNISVNGDFEQFLKNISSVRVRRSLDTPESGSTLHSKVEVEMTKNFVGSAPSELGDVQKPVSLVQKNNGTMLRKKEDLVTGKGTGIFLNKSAKSTIIENAERLTLQNGPKKERRKKIFYLNKRLGFHAYHRKESTRKSDLGGKLNGAHAIFNNGSFQPSEISGLQAIGRNKHASSVKSSSQIKGTRKDSELTKPFPDMKASNEEEGEGIGDAYTMRVSETSDSVGKHLPLLSRLNSQVLRPGSSSEKNSYKPYNSYDITISNGGTTYSHLASHAGFGDNDGRNLHSKDDRTRLHTNTNPHNYQAEYSTNRNSSHSSDGVGRSPVNRMGLIDDTSPTEHPQQAVCNCDDLGLLGSASGFGVLASIGRTIAERLTFKKKKQVLSIKMKHYIGIEKIGKNEKGFNFYLSPAGVGSHGTNALLSPGNGISSENGTSLISNDKGREQTTTYAIELDFPAFNGPNLNTTFPELNTGKEKDLKRIHNLPNWSVSGVLTNPGSNGPLTHLSAPSQWDAQQAALPGARDAQQRVTRATKRAVERNARVSASYLADYNERRKHGSKHSGEAVAEPTAPIGDQIVEFLLEDQMNGRRRDKTNLKEMQRYLDLLKSPGEQLTLNKKETDRFIQINQHLKIALFFFEQHLLSSMGNASRLETFDRLWSCSSTNVTAATRESNVTSAAPHSSSLLEEGPKNTAYPPRRCDCTSTTLGSLAGFTALSTLLGYTLTAHQQPHQ